MTILEFCDGSDLDRILKKNIKLNEKETREIIKQLTSALLYLDQGHSKVIHYDIKPQNILVEHSGQVKLTDFGLCKILQNDEHSKMELTSQGVGTYWYLPPECFMDRSKAYISNKVDIWSLGVVAFQMLYGKRPFGHQLTPEKIQNDQIILKSKRVKFPNKPNISKEMRTFIERCLEYDQDRRISIAEAVQYFQK